MNWVAPNFSLRLISGSPFFLRFLLSASSDIAKAKSPFILGLASKSNRDPPRHFNKTAAFKLINPSVKHSCSHRAEFGSPVYDGGVNSDISFLNLFSSSSSSFGKKKQPPRFFFLSFWTSLSLSSFLSTHALNLYVFACLGGSANFIPRALRVYVCVSLPSFYLCRKKNRFFCVMEKTKINVVWGWIKKKFSDAKTKEKQ